MGNEDKMYSVCVLMSTYNGEKYLKEQIDSILNQKDVDVHLVVRDDGSTDKTTLIIRKYIRENAGQIELLEGKNIGYEKSFDTLLRYAGGYDYYAFSDQDDIWDENKLIYGIETLQKKGAEFYCSNLRLVDEGGNYIRPFLNYEEDYISHESAILNSGVTGCTIIINNRLHKEYLKYRPSRTWVHDYWTVTLALFISRVTYDKEMHISYRQHGENVTGGTVGIRNRMERRKKSLKRMTELPYSHMAKDLLKGYESDLKDEDKEILRLLCTYKGSLKRKLLLLKRNDFKKESVWKNIVLSILVLVGRV